MFPIHRQPPTTEALGFCNIALRTKRSFRCLKMME
jgi:hypothetical protein